MALELAFTLASVVLALMVLPQPSAMRMTLLL